MKATITCGLSIALLACGISAALADDGAFPRALAAAEIQKLYGDRASLIDAAGVKGHFRYEVMTDGRLIGHNLDLIGSAAAANGTSDGKWRVDAANNKVCHEWANPRWQNACFAVLQTGPAAYEWSPTGSPGGTKFTLSPK